MYNVYQGAILLQILLFSTFKFQVSPATVCWCSVCLCWSLWTLLSFLLILVGRWLRMRQARGCSPDISITVSATNIPSKEIVRSTSRVSLSPSPTLALVTTDTAAAFSQWILPVWVQSETEAWPERSRERTAVVDIFSSKPLLPIQPSIFLFKN